MLKLTVDVHLSTTTKNGCFPNDLKPASPVFKKDNDCQLHGKQIASVTARFSEKPQHTQHCLVSMIDN